MTRLQTILLAFSAAATLTAPGVAQEGEKQPALIHSATDIAHEFTFYFDGRFAAQYTAANGGVDARIWCTLHEYDLTDVNLLVLPGGATPCPYSEEDIAAVQAFLDAGGGVLLLGSHGTFRDETSYRPNELARVFGAEFVPAVAKEPLRAHESLGVEELTTYGGKTLELTRLAEWEVLVEDADGRTVMARRSVGRGKLLVACYGLNGHRPDASDPINQEMWQALLLDLASEKKVDPARPPRSRMPENVTEKQGLKIQCSDYLEPMAEILFEQYERSLPLLNEICGVPPSPGMLTTLILLPTGGGGFSSGVAIGLGVWWGGFPGRQYGMIELIGHEAGHSWVLPFAEPMWNEPIATYIGAQLAKRLGLNEEAERTIRRTIEGARKLDPEMKTYDIAHGSDVPRDVAWGKTMWIWEQLTAEKPDALARYFRAKRRLVDPARQQSYTPDDCAAVLSVAMGRDLFPWLRSLGLTVDPSRTEIGFTPQELRTDTLHVTVDPTGRLSALVDPRDGHDYLAAGQPAPLLRVRVEGEYLEPERLRFNGERWALEFPGGVQVRLEVQEKQTHLRFEVVGLDPAGRVELVMWGPIPTKIRESVGETIGVVRGERFAIGLQGLNPKTLGGAATTEDDVMPSYNIFAGADYRDVAGDVKELYRGDAALRTEFGSTIQAYTRDRSKDRVIENWGHPRFVAPAYEDGGVVGSAIALFGCPVEDALETIGRIELAEGLPHPLLDGEWAKTSREATASYLIIGFGEDSIDEAIALTERAGLKFLYHGGPFKSWGHFELNEQQFPNGWEGLRACVDHAKEHDLGVGVHTLSNFISTSDPLVTPVPDPGLAVVGTTALLGSLDAEATELEVEDAGWFLKSGALRTARIGDELIQYGAVEGNSLSKCQRGAFGTAATAHAVGSEVSKLIDHGYRTFLTDAALSQTVAERIAELFNQTGLRQISFDGLEGNWSTGMGQYGRTLFTKWWYDALEPELRGRVITDASNPGHYFWHVYTRMNWGEPWYAGFRESQTQYRLMNQRYFARNLMPRMLGWFKMTPATSLEDAEWLLARAAGFDAGFAFVTGPDTVAKNGNGEAILDAIGTWEAARLAGAFPPPLKEKLQDISREYTLAADGDEWVLREVYSFQGTHDRREQPGMPTVAEFGLSNPFAAQCPGLILRCTGKVAAREIVLELDGRETALDASLEPGQAVCWTGAGEAVICDESWRELGRIALDPEALRAPLGESRLRVTCRFDGADAPELKVELRTIGAPLRLSRER